MRTLLLVCTFAAGLSAADPRAISMHPFTGQRGLAFTATVRGNNIKDANAAFPEQPNLRLSILSTGTEGKSQFV